MKKIFCIWRPSHERSTNTKFFFHASWIYYKLNVFQEIDNINTKPHSLSELPSPSKPPIFFKVSIFLGASIFLGTSIFLGAPSTIDFIKPRIDCESTASLDCTYNSNLMRRD